MCDHHGTQWVTVWVMGGDAAREWSDGVFAVSLPRSVAHMC